ncbi:MAG TPA: type I-C CRISPR-associated protein Cas5c, partial [Thermoanaerobaculia bacterium]
MTQLRSPTLRLRARGPLACFTRPELKVERVSYPVMTPSAARGLLEAVMWKPAIQWRIGRIHVLKPIRFIAFRRNEVSHRAVAPAAAVVRDGGEISSYFADDDRAQRNTLALREVDYLIEARFEMTERAGPLDNLTKFVEIFERRLAKGQCFHQPYFGCRELDAEVLPAEGAPPAEDITQELGLMLWDVEYSPKRNRPVFFQA